MRKKLLIAIFILSSTVGFSQFKLGFKFSPTLSTNRVDSDSDVSFQTDGAALRYSAGLIADIPIAGADNYYVSTGVFFVPKRAAFKATDNTGTIAPTTEQYNLQYLQIPLSLKLFTNEVALDKKIYFQVGATMEFNVKEEPKKETNIYIEDLNLFDTSLLIGVGMEYKIGINTIVFGGFSYHRGMLNTVADHREIGGDFKLKNDYLGLDLGVKF